MSVLKIIIFILAMFSGTIFSVFVLTAIEAKSPKFQDSFRKFHQIFSKGTWTLFLIIAAIGSAVLFYRAIPDYARGGIASGLVTGIFFFLRSGPNINYEDMEKAAKEFDKEQQAKRTHRGKQTRGNYKGAVKGSKGSSKGSASLPRATKKLKKK